MSLPASETAMSFAVFGPDARHLAERRVVFGADGLRDLRRGQRGEHAERRLRADARDAAQQVEDLELVGASAKPNS